MGHTNQTANYNLPQFVGTDKPSWLGDINDAFAAIDTAIAAAASEASTADGKADALGTTVSGHTTQIGTLQNTVTTQGNTLNTVTSLIGNGQPTTEDRTIIGGLNEIDAHLTANGKRLVFSYDATSQKYGFTIDGVFYPLGDDPSAKWNAITDQSLLTAVGRTGLTAPTIVPGSGSVTLKTNGDGTQQNGIIWVNAARSESITVTITGTVSVSGADPWGCKIVKHNSITTGDDTECTTLATLSAGSVNQTFTLNAGEYIGVWMSNNAAPTTVVSLVATVFKEN